MATRLRFATSGSLALSIADASELLLASELVVVGKYFDLASQFAAQLALDHVFGAIRIVEDSTSTASSYQFTDSLGAAVGDPIMDLIPTDAGLLSLDGIELWLTKSIKLATTQVYLRRH